MEALGFHIFVALLTTMMVWFGVQEPFISPRDRLQLRKVCRFRCCCVVPYTFIEFTATQSGCRLFIQGLHQCWRATLQHHRPRRMTRLSNHRRHAKPARGGIVKAMMNTYYALTMVFVQLLLGSFSHHRGDRRIRISGGGCHAFSVRCSSVSACGQTELSVLGWLRLHRFQFLQGGSSAVLNVLGTLPALLHESDTLDP